MAAQAFWRFFKVGVMFFVVYWEEIAIEQFRKKVFQVAVLLPCHCRLVFNFFH